MVAEKCFFNFRLVAESRINFREFDNNSAMTMLFN
jgi:hypothetical protein